MPDTPIPPESLSDAPHPTYQSPPSADVPEPDRETGSRRLTASSGLRSALKLLVLGILALLLLIPLAFVHGLVNERHIRSLQVKNEIGQLWGGEQVVGAVVLRVPFRYRVHENRWEVADLYWLPETVHWTGHLEPDLRRRGLFEVPVYGADLEATGRVTMPDLEELGVAPEAILWSRATVQVAVSDLSGIEEPPTLRWQSEILELEPGPVPVAGLGGGSLVAPLGTEGRGEGLGRQLEEGIGFSLTLALRGTERLGLLPLGDVTTAELSAPWGDPKFEGKPLPAEHRVDEESFTASWSVPHYGRGFPGAWVAGKDHPTYSSQGSDRMVAVEQAAVRLEGGAVGGDSFGVSLLQSADQYQRTERSTKYGLLFIGLTFGTLLLLELRSPIRLHGPQYLLVGFALCLFYVLLLALAEHLGFGAAYWIASGATVGLISLYGRSLLASWARVLPLTATLAALYGYLYVLLGLEDYALLFGALGLFVFLALAMYLTRNLDWRTLKMAPGGGLGEGSLSEG